VKENNMRIVKGIFDKCIIIFGALFLLNSVAGVSSAAERKLQVLTSTSDLKSIAEFIGGDKVEATSIAAGYQDPHFVEAKPSYMLKARNADLFIKIGMDLELGWENLILEGARNPRILVGTIGHLDASFGIEKLDLPLGSVDRSMGDVHPLGNPHYWLDPLNAKIIAANIAARLSQILPQAESYFRQNLSEFNKKIDQKMLEWKAKLEPFKGESIAIYHRSWTYFANRFGLNVACSLEPKPGIPPSPGHLKQVIEIIKQKGIKAILMEVFYDEKPARFVAGQTGAKVVIVPNSVGGTKEAQDYFSLIDTIIEKLVLGMKP
jgi:ABC-type Zn uptake system ZnuABC Zn-binding protein ZnuA